MALRKGGLAAAALQGDWKQAITNVNGGVNGLNRNLRLVGKLQAAMS